MKRRTYLKPFENEQAAVNHMRWMNQGSADRTIFCLVAGFSGDDFAVVDSRTAISLGLGYRWEK
jgi:hypothetical protein